MDKLAEIIANLEAAEKRGEDLLADAEAGKKDLAEVKALVLDEIKPEIDSLKAQKAEAVREEEMKALKTEFGNLQSIIEDLRKPAGDFVLPTDATGAQVLDAKDPYANLDLTGEGKALVNDTYGIKPEASTASFFADVFASNSERVSPQLRIDARERLLYGYENAQFEGKALSAEGKAVPEAKAMSEGVAGQGGYLVRPQIERQIVIAREQDNVLRGLCSSITVTSNSIQLDQIGIATTAGWVAELAQKPESTSMSTAQVVASVFTAAGLVTISNQLLADANPAVDALATADLAKRLVALEEAAFLAGDGTGKPLGILNTPNIGATPLTSTAVIDLIDAVLDAIASVESEHGAPTAILMHPRTWTRILKSRDSQGAFYINPAAGVQDARTLANGPTKSLWGYPVVTTNRMPTNLGGATNESRIIVADFKECLILDRQGITVDSSPHVLFTSNQTIFRAEQRVGFTAARTPKAINVVGGAGLANG
jgi:HK97 family phage major capsid protein